MSRSKGSRKAANRTRQKKPRSPVARYGFQRHAGPMTPKAKKDDEQQAIQEGLDEYRGHDESG